MSTMLIAAIVLALLRAADPMVHCPPPPYDPTKLIPHNRMTRFVDLER